MRSILLVTVLGLGLAVDASPSKSQAAATSEPDAPEALIDHPCRGPDTFTGVALNPVTIETAGFLCNQRDIRMWPTSSVHVTLPPLIHIAFKDAGVRMTAGDTLTVKGSLYTVNDKHAQMTGWLLKDAEILKTAPDANSPPTPGTEAALRRYIESLEKGTPNYDEMEPRLARAVYARTQWIFPYIQQAGAFKSLRYLFTVENGISVYQADFEHGSAEWLIAPIPESGKVRMQGFLPLPASLRCGSTITYSGEGPFGQIAPWRCQEWGG